MLTIKLLIMKHLWSI